jgi:hypothetical protein
MWGNWNGDVYNPGSCICLDTLVEFIKGKKRSKCLAAPGFFIF